MVTVSSKSRHEKSERRVGGGDPVSMGANGASRDAFQAAAIKQNYGSNFARSMRGMILLEGNYGSNLGDGAGYTFCGLTQRHNGTGDASTANGMSIGSVNQRYREGYWNNVGLDQIAAVNPAFAFRCFDAHVNSGKGGLSHMLTFVCSRLGIEGGKSVQSKMAAILQALKDHKVSEDDVHRECHNGRMAFYRHCRQWGKFANGWTNRMTKVAKIVAEMRNTPFNPADIDFSAFGGGGESGSSSANFFIPSPSMFVSIGARLFSFVSGVLPSLPDVVVTADKRELSEEEGESLGLEDSKRFTQQFGPVKRTFGLDGTSMGIVPQPPAAPQPTLEPKPDGLRPMAFKANSNEAALSQIGIDAAREELYKQRATKQKKEESNISIFGWKMFSS